MVLVKTDESKAWLVPCLKKKQEALRLYESRTFVLGTPMLFTKVIVQVLCGFFDTKTDETS